MTDSKPFLIKTDSIITGLKNEKPGKHYILIEKGKIKEIGILSELRKSLSNINSFEYKNSTALPGLVDGHTHMIAPGTGQRGDDIAKEKDEFLLIRAVKNAKLALESGVTTARENGAKNNIGFILKEAIKNKLTDGPEMIVCGRPLTITAGHLGYLGSETDGINEIKKETRKLIKEGADFLKIAATGGSTITSNPLQPAFSVEELKSISEEAKRFNKLTAAHCASNLGIDFSLQAKIDMIIHCIFNDENGNYKYREDLVEKILKNETWINPTLQISIYGLENIKENFSNKKNLSEQEKSLLDSTKKQLDSRFETVSKLITSGARIMAGSDSPWGSYPPGKFYKEIEALNIAGMSNYESILAGTKYSAESIGLKNKSGTIEEGRNADIVIVRGNPLKNISCLSHPIQVYKKGIKQKNEL